MSIAGTAGAGARGAADIDGLDEGSEKVVLTLGLGGG